MTPEFQVIIDFIEGLGFCVFFNSDTWYIQVTKDEILFEISIINGNLVVERWFEYELSDEWVKIALISLSDPKCFDKLKEALVKNNL